MARKEEGLFANREGRRDCDLKLVGGGSWVHGEGWILDGVVDPDGVVDLDDEEGPEGKEDRAGEGDEVLHGCWCRDGVLKGRHDGSLKAHGGGLVPGRTGVWRRRRCDVFVGGDD